MSKAKAKPLAAPLSQAEAARQSPTAVFDEPNDVLQANDLTKKEKASVLDQWEADAKSLQTATDEGMLGGMRPRLDEVKAAQIELDASRPVTGDEAGPEISTALTTVTADSARGALGPDKTSHGDSLLPMLIGGLILVVVGMIAVLMLG